MSTKSTEEITLASFSNASKPQRKIKTPHVSIKDMVRQSIADLMIDGRPGASLKAIKSHIDSVYPRQPTVEKRRATLVHRYIKECLEQRILLTTKRDAGIRGLFYYAKSKSQTIRKKTVRKEVIRNESVFLVKRKGILLTTSPKPRKNAKKRKLIRL